MAERCIRRAVGGALLVVLLGPASCAGQSKATTSGIVTLRLGYYANLTHAPAILGVEDGIFAKALGSQVRLETKTFNAGPAAVEALFAGAVDATFLGPSPAINAFQKSGGTAVRIVAGSTSGGAALVVKPTITSPADLRSRKIATPQLGNTQDVALRSWLKRQGLKTTQEGGGDVSVLPQDNAQTLDAFQAGRIDGAWVPEPWASRLVVEGGGKILVDEASLWPGGRYTTTALCVRTEFLRKHRDVVKGLISGEVEAIERARTDPAARRTVNDAIAKITGKSLKQAVLAAAWPRLSFTYDPLTATLARSARDAKELGFLSSADVGGITDLTLLNEVLRQKGRPTVS